MLSIMRKSLFFVALVGSPLLLAPGWGCGECDLSIEDVTVVAGATGELHIVVENIGTSKADAWLDVFVGEGAAPALGDKADVSAYTGVVAPGETLTVVVDLASFTTEPDKAAPVPAFAILDEGLGCDDKCLETNAVEVSLHDGWSSYFRL